MLDMPGYEKYMWPDWQDHYTDAEVIVFLELFSTDWIYQNHYKNVYSWALFETYCARIS